MAADPATAQQAQQALQTADPSPTNPWLAFFTPQDSHGLSPWQYELSVDQGGAGSPAKAVAYFFAYQGWLTYRFFVVAVMWLLDFVLQFKQLALLQPPAEAVAASVQSVTGQLGLVPMMVTVSVVMSAVWLFRGRSGAAAGEIATTVVIAALLGGVLANPVGVLTGPDGALPLARDAGVSISANLVGGASYAGTGASLPAPQTSEQLRASIDAKVLDNLVRVPHQLINYGQVLDTTKPGTCVDAYNKALGVTDDAGRNAVAGACGKDVHDASDNTFAVELGVIIVSVSGYFFFGLVLALALALLVFTALALWEAAKFVVVLITSLIPGNSRASMFISLATVVICVGLCAATLIGVGLLLLVLNAVFVATASWSPVTVFLMVDLMLLGGAVVTVIQIFRAKSRARRLGERMSKAIQPRPTSLPRGGGLLRTARQVATGAVMMRQANRLRRGLASAGGGHASGHGGGHAGSHGGPRPAGLGGSAGRGGAAGAGRGRAGVLGGVAKAAFTVGKVGLASTIGAPVYGPRAALAAKTALAARKASMVARLGSATIRGAYRVQAAHAGAAAFGQEYAHNVAAAGRFVGRATGATRLMNAADPGRPAPMNGPSGDGTAASSRSSTGAQVDLKPAVMPQFGWSPTSRKKPPPPPSPAAYTPGDRARPARATRSAFSAPGSPPAPPPPPLLPSAISYPQSAGDRLRARMQARKGR